MNDTLIFTIATGGYHWRYRKNIESQRAYAAKHGYVYSVVDWPKFTLLDLEIVWLKIYLLHEALKKEYRWVAFVDADAEIKPRCPPVSHVYQPGKSIYAAKGYSNRVNSGVLIFHNDNNSRAFVAKVLVNRTQPIPTEDSVGWGENGHVIHFAKQNPHVLVLDKRWNNNHNPDLHDYIRHYSAGPLRSTYIASVWDSLRFTLCRYAQAISRRVCARVFRAKPTGELLQNLCSAVVKRDKAFAR